MLLPPFTRTIPPPALSWIEFDCTALPIPVSTRTPLCPLSAMMLPWAAAVPPTWLKLPEMISTPTPLLPRGVEPSAATPMSLPWITLLSLVANEPPELSSETPLPLFPEMTLRAPEVVPPIVFELLEIKRMPPPALGTAVCPVTSVPMKFPVTRLPKALDPLITRPAPWKPSITSPRTVSPFETRVSPSPGKGAVEPG